MRILRTVPLIAALLCLAACSGGPEAPQDVTQSPYYSDNDRVIDLDGQTIRYRDTGPDGAQAIVLLHGFTDSLHTWDGIADILDDEYRVLRPDLPGHGLSGPSPDGNYSNEALIDFVGDFIAQTEAEAPILVGNSLGGLAAWRYTADSQAQEVSGLVLLAPGGVPHNGVSESPAEVPAMLSFYLKNAPKAGVQAAMEAMYADPERLTEARVSQYRDLMAGQGEAFVARAGQFTLPDPVVAFAQIDVPTIIIWGEADRVLPPDHGAIFAENIEGSELIRLEGVGHLPQAEAPDTVIDAIRQLAATEEARP